MSTDRDQCACVPAQRANVAGLASSARCARPQHSPSNRSVWCTDSALGQYMYFLVMSQHTIHYDMNINEPRQCCFDSEDSLTGFILQPVSLISMASVVQFQV